MEKNRKELSVVTDKEQLFVDEYLTDMNQTRAYNPPKRKQSWVNKKYNTQFIQKNTYVHHSTYLENPYTSKETIEEAEE